MKIRVYTKTRHVDKIDKFFKSLRSIDYKIFTIHDFPEPEKPHVTADYDLDQFDLGISYCYPRKILAPLLSAPKLGFINFHPAPLLEYKGPTELINAIRNRETNWGVTAHYMNEDYDHGKIIKVKKIKLHEPPTDSKELGAVSHYFLFSLFKEIIEEIYEK